MNIQSFQRVFSKSMYKTLKFPLGEMTFTKDFVTDKRGDLYPLIAKEEGCNEWVNQNRYGVEKGFAQRMFTRFFPYATYEVSFSSLQGSCGFCFHLAETKATLFYNGSAVTFCDGTESCFVEYSQGCEQATMIVSCRPGFFDVYFENNGKVEYCHTFSAEIFKTSNEYKRFCHGYVSVYAKDVMINSVCSYMDCGISQGDIRAICYENGDVMFENGKVYFTASIRIQEGGFQGIFSWTPSTSNIEFTGALFFDVGDGFWRNYLASSLLYHRPTKEWYIWTSSFEHKHILCHGAFAGDPRFGVNVVDVTMMKAAEDEDRTAFAGFKGDEDPDFYYDEETGKWNMAICRVFPEMQGYQYVFFQSESPFDGYTYIGKGYKGSETGGSFVKIGEGMAFFCGNDPQKRSNYRIYTKSGMEEAKFDFDDGGFRGWGTVIPVKMGSRRRYFWLTFDRHNGSSYNWSYGNIYCFEGILE